MTENLYPDIKFLVSSKEWSAYEVLLDREKQRLLNVFEVGDEAAESLRLKIQELNRVLRLPHQLIREHEQKVKERL